MRAATVGDTWGFEGKLRDVQNGGSEWAGEISDDPWGRGGSY